MTFSSFDNLKIANHLFVDTPYIHFLINHPPHIINSPSAFIPFCEYGGNMLAMGEKIEQFSLPVCTKFVPVILEGQLCYQVDVNDIQIKGRKAEAKLTFLLDYNEDRNTNALSESMKTPNVNLENLEKMINTDSQDNKAIINIEIIGNVFQAIFKIQPNINLT